MGEAPCRKVRIGPDNAVLNVVMVMRPARPCSAVIVCEYEADDPELIKVRHATKMSKRVIADGYVII